MSPARKMAGPTRLGPPFHVEITSLLAVVNPYHPQANQKCDGCRQDPEEQHACQVHPIHAEPTRIVRTAPAVRAWRVLDALIDCGGDRWDWRRSRIGWDEAYGSSAPIVQELKSVRIANIRSALV